MTRSLLLASLALALACGSSSTPEPTEVGSSEGASAGAETEARVAVSAHPPSAISATAPEGPVERYQVPVGSSPVRGDGALVTIVAFSEFQCPFCGRAQPTLERVLERYPRETRLVFKHRVLPFHQNARPAALAAEEVRTQLGDEGFWRVHDAFFADQRNLELEDLVSMAQRVGADGSAVRAAVTQATHAAVLEQDDALAQRLSALGTPTFFINGRPLVGAQPFEAFATIVEEEIALARQRGGNPATYYDALLASAPVRREPPSRPGRAPTPPDTTVYHVPVDSAPQRGPDDALVTIVQFTDLECPFCARVEPTLREVEQRYGNDVRILFRNNPLPFHTHAMLAHEFALAVEDVAGDQAFWQFTELVFANRSAMERSDLEAHVRTVGANLRRVRRLVDRHAHQARIEQDQGLARNIGAAGTPTFFINGRKLTGAQPIDAFVRLIDEVKLQAEQRVQQGTARADVYEAIIASGMRQVPAPAPSPSAAPTPPAVLNVVPAVPATAPARGPAGALTIQIFSDFECPFCSRAVPTIDRVVQTYGNRVRVVFRHMPLAFHQHAREAAEASMEVRAQAGDDAFWRYHDLLFANQRALTTADLERYASQVGGVDLTRFRSALQQHVHAAAIDADVAVAGQIGIRGTPSFVVGNRVIRGAQPFVNFEEAIDAQLP